jgi:MFS transporter, PAT family, beta-lactamase induction signal transducer AmpG
MGDTGWRSLILTESGKFRLGAFFLFYFGQGLPIGVTAVAFPAWLAANGAPDADVAAVISVAFLPWSFKFVIAAVMDRYAYLEMGRRRAWLIFSQLMMVAGFLIASVIAPTPDDVQTILVVTFLVMSGGAMQDVAVDGLAVDLLPEAEQGTASSFMFGGQTVGRALSGAAAGFGLQYYGSQATFLAFLPVIGLVTVFAIVMRERPGEKRFPWNRGEVAPENRERHVGAWLPIFLVTIKSLLKRDSLKLLGAAGFSRCGSGIFDPMFPIIATAFVAFDTASYSGMISTVDFFSALAAIAIGSFLALKLGPRRATVAVYLCYAALGALIMFGREIWTTTWIFVAMCAVWSLCNTLASICSNPLRMQLSDPKVAATQFTIYNSLSNLPVSLGAGLFAVLGGTADLVAVMAAAIGLFAIGCALYCWMAIGGRPVKVEPVPEFN